MRLTEAREDDSRAGSYDYCADCRQKFAPAERRLILGDRAYHAETCGPAPAGLAALKGGGDG